MKPKIPFLNFLKFLFPTFMVNIFRKDENGKITPYSIYPSHINIRKWGIISAALLSFSVVTWGQKTWDAGGDGINWSSPNNWAPNGVPLSTDDVTISRNGGYTVNLDGNFTCANLTLNYTGNTNGIISLNFLGSNSLTVTNTVSLINAASDGGSNVILAVANGNLTCAGIANTESTSAASDISITLQNGIINCSGNITTGSTTDRNDITVTGNGTINIEGNFSTAGTFVAGTGTVNYNGPAAQGIAALTYYNLNCSVGGTKTLPDADVTINGSLDISNSTLAFTSAQARVLNVTGDLSGNGTIDMSPGSITHSLNLGGVSNDIGHFNQ